MKGLSFLSALVQKEDEDFLHVLREQCYDARMCVVYGTWSRIVPRVMPLPDSKANTFLSNSRKKVTFINLTHNTIYDLKRNTIFPNDNHLFSILRLLAWLEQTDIYLQIAVKCM
jgi:hypothetical protein